MAGLFLAGVGVAMLVAARAARPASRAVRPGPRLLVSLALLLAYAATLEPLGYVLATFLLLAALFADRCEPRRVAVAVAAAAATTGVTWMVFSVWLRLAFPRGVFP